MLPDNDGNTLLHLFCQQQLKEKDYNFLKNAIQKHHLRLTRNQQGKTALNLVKKHAGREVDLKGKPNYSRKMWEWFEMLQDQNPNFVDLAE